MHKTTDRLHFHRAATEPEPEEREALEGAYKARAQAREGEGSDAEHEAARELIELLMWVAHRHRRPTF